MYTFKKCSEVSDTVVYETFTAAFADYMLKFEMDEEFFVGRFFGPDNNHRDYSYIAFDGEKGVGVTLGGLKTDEVHKTFRCGGMGLVPDVRGSGLANELMKLHQDKAVELGCKQLFLEVIDGNDRAIAFYKKLNYEKVYDLKYRWLDLDENELYDKEYHNDELEVKEIDNDELKKLRQYDTTHLAWQHCFEYMKGLDSKYFGIYDGDRLVAGLGATSSRANYLFVLPEYRLKGYAKALLNTAIREFGSGGLMFVYSNNSSCHTFTKHYQMNEMIGQLEMYKWL